MPTTKTRQDLIDLARPHEESAEAATGGVGGRPYTAERMADEYLALTDGDAEAAYEMLEGDIESL